jgi:hypothetical protein
MREDLDSIESMQPVELGEAVLDLVSGGSYPALDPNG